MCCDDETGCFKQHERPQQQLLLRFSLTLQLTEASSSCLRSCSSGTEPRRSQQQLYQLKRSLPRIVLAKMDAKVVQAAEQQMRRSAPEQHLSKRRKTGEGEQLQLLRITAQYLVSGTLTETFAPAETYQSVARYN